MLESHVEKLLKQRYYINEKETWELLCQRIVDHVGQNETKEIKQEFYNSIYNRIWLPNSPCIVNSGKNNGGLFACFVVGPEEDTLENHFETLKDIADVAKAGGGCGFSLNNIRPANSPVAGSSNGYSYGGLKWAALVSQAMDMMTQSGFRKMALMTSMDGNHKDAEDFINLKKNGNDNTLYNFNMSLMVDDNWMLNSQKPFTKENDLFDKLTKNAWASAEPGLLFYTKINSGPYAETGQEVYTTNPCFVSGTKVHTRNGHFNIEDLVGEVVDVWNGETWQSVNNFRVTGRNQETLKITLHDGSEIKCTPYHTFILEDGERITAEELSIGDRLKISDAPNSFGNKKINSAYAKGFLIGDGTLARDGTRPILYLYPPKYMLEERLINSFSELEPIKYGTNELYELGFHDCTSGKRKISEGITCRREELAPYIYNIPDEMFEANYESICEFIAGYMDADGTANDSGKSGFRYQISSISRENLLKFQQILKIIGVQSTLRLSKLAEKKDFNDGYGEYESQDLYRLTIAQQGSVHLAKQVNFGRLESFADRQLKLNMKPRWNRIVSIDSDIVADKVYCCTVEGKHQFSLTNGTDVLNCGEQPIPPYGSCNLGSININHDIFYNEDGSFNFDELSKQTSILTRFLDNVGTINKFPNKKFSDWYVKNRPVGSGLMGVADAFIRLKLTYGQPDSLKFFHEVMNTMLESATETSEELGKERGIPEECKKLSKPRRNITLLSIAPTGSIAFISNCSHSIEPIFSPDYVRTDERGETYTFTREDKNNPYFKACVGVKESQIVKPIEHLYIQAVAQKYVDSGVSKTINLPESATVDDIKEIYLNAWKMGCKGITVYRDNSRSIQVLNHTKEELDIDEDVCDNDCSPDSNKFDCDSSECNIIATEGCHSCTTCGVSMCSV